MGVAGKAVITIKDIAAAARLSIATVSYALRNNPKIPSDTRERVRGVAQRLGYRPNPRIASLMAHIRGAYARPSGERLAFLWVHTSRSAAARDPFLRKVFAGARERAEQRGFGLEVFWTSDPGMSEHRLQEILRARGIVGVVLSPVTSDEASVHLDWNWQEFAGAVIGNVTWDPELHHASHHHYLGMRLALLELAKLGYRRPAALLDRETNERAKRAWSASFLAHHPAPSGAPALVHLTDGTDRTDVRKWFAATKADVLIVSGAALPADLGLRGAVRSAKVPVVSLHWDGSSDADAGIDQCYDLIAASAVDLVITQLNSNETGAPDLPRIMLFPGRWVPPMGSAAAAAQVVSCRAKSAD